MIEKGVPIPPAQGQRYTYPFPNMEPGDSFLWEGEYDSLRAAASAYGKRHNMKFATRKTRNGLRCWRVT